MTDWQPADPIRHEPDDALASVPPLELAPPSMRSRTIRGISLATIGYAMTQGGNFLAYLVLVRLLSPRAFGLYAAGTVITGIGGLFAESGMLAALIKREDRLDEAASTAFASLLLTGSGLTLASLAISPLLSLAFHDSEVGQVAAVLSGWMLIRALTIVPDALLQRRFSFARRVLVDPLGVLAYAAAAIPLAAAGAGVWAMVAGAYASITVEAGFAWIAAAWRPRLKLMSFSLWRELAAFARPLVIGEILRRLTLVVDTFMLGRVRGAAALGQYRNGLMLAQQAPGAFGAIAAYVILPALARISGTPARLASASRQAYRAVYAAIVPVGAACVPLGVPVAVVLLGSRWRPAGHVIAGLSGFVLGGVVLSISGEVMKAAAALRLQLVVQALWFTLVAVTVVAAALAWGVFGVAIAVSVSTCAAAAFATSMLGRTLGIRATGLFDGLAAPVLASGVMVVAMTAFGAEVRLLSHAEVVELGLLAAESLLGAISYVGALLAIDRRRRQAAHGFIGRRLARRPTSTG